MGRPEHERSSPVLVGGPITSAEGAPTPSRAPLVKGRGASIVGQRCWWVSRICYRPTVLARVSPISARRLSVTDRWHALLVIVHHKSAGEPPASARRPPLSARGPSVRITGPLYLSRGLLAPKAVLETPVSAKERDCVSAGGCHTSARRPSVLVEGLRMSTRGPRRPDVYDSCLSRLPELLLCLPECLQELKRKRPPVSAIRSPLSARRPTVKPKGPLSLARLSPILARGPLISVRASYIS